MSIKRFRQVAMRGEQIDIGPGLSFDTGTRETEYVIEDLQNGGSAHITVQSRGQIFDVSMSADRTKLRGNVKKAAKELCDKVGKDVWYTASEREDMGPDERRR